MQSIYDLHKGDVKDVKNWTEVYDRISRNLSMLISLY